MNLDPLELLGRQRFRFREDVFGDCHVADVMQQRRGAHGLDFRIGEAGGFGERCRVLLDGSDVLRRAARFRLDRERQRFDRRELDLHRAVRLILLLPEACHDRVITPEHEIQRHGQ